ncbi:hypothetical protein [Luteococcus sp. OSA5]|uniref:hypothetical protein n=1 Tax=Luteococcus sp. OSA5 TaxID=3401630 RepID=UPI003B42FA68
MAALDNEVSKCSQVADHFWCEVLATLGDLLNDWESFAAESAEILAEHLAKELLGRMDLSGRRWTPVLAKSIIEAVLTEMLTKLATPVMPGVWTIPITSRHCRLLAILMCPAPENHPHIRETCLAPFLKTEALAPEQQQLVVLVPALRDGIERL